MAKAKPQEQHSLIPAERIHHLYQTMTRLAGKVDHPAAFAGCFVHLRAGDAVFPRNHIAAAETASGAKFAAALPDDATLNQISEGARARSTGVLVAVPRERDLLATEAIAAGRKVARLHLPLVLMTFSRAMPQPGAPQKRIGIPEISVAADDAVAVYRVAEESFWRARTGVGPTWIRCITRTF